MFCIQSARSCMGVERSGYGRTRKEITLVRTFFLSYSKYSKYPQVSLGTQSTPNTPKYSSTSNQIRKEITLVQFFF